MNSHERAFVESFVCAPRRERFLAALENPNKRRVFTGALCHPKTNFLLFDRASAIERSGQTAPFIAERLRKMGAPDDCYVMGGQLDQQELGLDEALTAEVGFCYGIVISCLPGKLVYLESEDGRWIFHKL